MTVENEYEVHYGGEGDVERKDFDHMKIRKITDGRRFEISVDRAVKGGASPAGWREPSLVLKHKGNLKALLINQNKHDSGDEGYWLALPVEGGEISYGTPTDNGDYAFVRIDKEDYKQITHALHDFDRIDTR